MNKPAYLFLDIDGVLNTYAGDLYHALNNTHAEQRIDSEGKDFKDGLNTNTFRFDHFLSKGWCPMAVTNLSWLLKVVPELKIVLSSTWRIPYNKETVKGMFLHYPDIAERVIDVTPVTREGFRGNEILIWLDNNQDDSDPNYVILDDDSDFNGDQLPRLVQTDSHEGFTYSKLREAICILGYTLDDLSDAFRKTVEAEVEEGK